MITEVRLAGLPCFGAEAMLPGLSQINYIFGPNGSGKTTISQYLASYDPVSSSSVSWQQHSNSVKVYNRSYVRASFTSADGEEPGVFLLGDDSRETFQRIGALEDEQKKINNKLAQQQETLDRFLNQLNAERSALAQTAWERRAVIPVALKDKMPGIKGSKEGCLDKVLAAAQTHPERGTDTFVTLEAKAKTAFDETILESSLLPPAPKPEWDEAAVQAVLMTPIVGSADVPLADLVERLSNSDWVREGLEHLHKGENAEKLCPFCQRSVPKDLAEELASIFDATYQDKRDEVLEFQMTLSNAALELKEYKTTHLDRLKALVPIEDPAQVFRALELAIDGVGKAIQQKVVKSSEKIMTNTIKTDYDLLEKLISSANEMVKTTNAIVADRREQRSIIVDAAWQEFARGHLNDLIEGFNQKSERKKKSIDGVKDAMSKQRERLAGVEHELRDLRKETTSSARTIQEINDLLALSQFHSFRLEVALSKSDGYRIIRDNGQPADIQTLSEGERTFITFLYFYHSLSGVRQDGETERITAVIDDPISSLDGDIMFVVSALTRRLVKEVRSDAHSRVSQMILLTHNSRFHNEVCYEHQGELSPAVKFYRIRKFSPDPNQVEDCGQRNPIRTAYQELWDEVAAAEVRPEGSMPWLPNVLRRILESYFTTLGDKENLYELGEDLSINERAFHDALIAWSHSGSHTIMDAETYTQPVATNGRWLAAFARVFEKNSGGAHIGHYEMMMDEARKHLLPRTSVAAVPAAL